MQPYGPIFSLRETLSSNAYLPYQDKVESFLDIVWALCKRGIKENHPKIQTALERALRGFKKTPKSKEDLMEALKIAIIDPYSELKATKQIIFDLYLNGYRQEAIQFIQENKDLLRF